MATVQFAGRRSGGWLDSAGVAGAGPDWTAGRQSPLKTFSGGFVAGQKPEAIPRFQRTFFQPFSRDFPTWPESILFGQAGFIILRPAPASDGSCVGREHPIEEPARDADRVTAHPEPRRRWPVADGIAIRALLLLPRAGFRPHWSGQFNSPHRAVLK
jgi:hypothetical protein